MKKFWQWSNAVESTDSELILDGPISDMTWWGDEVTPQEFRDELKKHKGALTVVINSPGGDVFAGISIYNALREFEEDVTVRVDGLAASIASVVAMAADKVIMSPGSMMMIHKPWTVAVGDANELDKVKEVLNSIESSIVPIYATRTGKSEDEVRELINSETWMTAEEAVELGFADELIEAKKASFSDLVKMAADNKLAFSMSAIKPSMDDLVEKVKAQAETPEEVKDDVTTPTETTNEVVEPEAEDTDEPEAEVIEDKPSEEETPMNEEQKAIAQAQVIEPSNQAPVEQKVEVKDYLKTDEAMEAFAQVLQSNPGEMGGDSAAKVRNAWKDHLEVKLGVTNPEIFLPSTLVQEIQNAFENGGEIWNRVTKVGADVWNAAWDTEDDVNSNDGRARGYRRSEAEDKAEQVLTFANRILRPQFVYKYITLNKEDIKEQRTTGALVRYVLTELPQRIVREVERAIVLSDGRGDSDDYKILEGNPRGFYPIINDTTADNYFAETLVLVGDESKAEAVAMAKDILVAPGEVVLIAKKGFSTAARFEKDDDGKLLFPLGTKATDVFDINTIIEPDWFNDTNSPDVDALVVVLAGYKVVGDTTIEGFQNFILKTNKQEYLQEIWAGGGLSLKKSAVAIPSASS